MAPLRRSKADHASWWDRHCASTESTGTPAVMWYSTRGGDPTAREHWHSPVAPDWGVAASATPAGSRLSCSLLPRYSGGEGRKGVSRRCFHSTGCKPLKARENPTHLENGKGDRCYNLNGEAVGRRPINPYDAIGFRVDVVTRWQPRFWQHDRQRETQTRNSAPWRNKALVKNFPKSWR